jgi:hypothetical protein
MEHDRDSMNMNIIKLSALLFVAFAAQAQAQTAIRITNCGDATPPAGASQTYMDAKGNLCTSSSGGTGSAVTTTPGARTIITLDIKTVTTGGTAVTAIAAGNRTAGGYIQNPPTATVNLCYNEIGTAVGTVTNGDTICIVPGASVVFFASGNAVSVITSDSAHAFGGYGAK